MVLRTKNAIAIESKVFGLLLWLLGLNLLLLNVCPWLRLGVDIIIGSRLYLLPNLLLHEKLSLNLLVRRCQVTFFMLFLILRHGQENFLLQKMVLWCFRNLFFNTWERTRILRYLKLFGQLIWIILIIGWFLGIIIFSTWAWLKLFQIDLFHLFIYSHISLSEWMLGYLLIWKLLVSLHVVGPFLKDDLATFAGVTTPNYVSMWLFYICGKTWLLIERVRRIKATRRDGRLRTLITTLILRIVFWILILY